MKNSLARVLIERGIINNNTRVDSYYYGRDLGMTKRKLVDRFSIIDFDHKVKDTKEQFIFTLMRNDGFKTKVSSNDILKIDGQYCSSIASAYDLNDDGTPRKIGKKRGRKSNNDKGQE